jgi:hypothetical protein
MRCRAPLTAFDDFFVDIDTQWPGDPTRKRVLLVLGSGALMLQTAYARRTKDGDVLETMALGDDVKAGLRAVAGPATPIHRRHGMFLDLVPNGVPFLPTGPIWRPVTALNARLGHSRFARWMSSMSWSASSRATRNPIAETRSP